MSGWKEELLKNLDREFQRGELKPFLQDIADRYGQNFGTVKATYYQLKKDREKYENNEESKEEVQAVEGKKEYKVGDWVKVKVLTITSYGVFAATPDGQEGLIHISEVRRTEFVKDLRRYFREGDEVLVKVRKIEEDGKLGFTAKDSELPDYYKVVAFENRPLEEKLQPLKEKITLFSEDREIGEIVSYLNNVIGMVSPKAKEEIRQVVAKHGFFKFSMALSAALKEFEADLGVQLVRLAEKKIGDGL